MGKKAEGPAFVSKEMNAGVSKKILVVTDFSLSENAGGIQQTLYNLLYTYPEGLIRNFTSQEVVKRNAPTGIFKENTITYRGAYISPMRNRLGPLFNGSIAHINRALTTSAVRRKWKEMLKGFAPDMIVCCPNGVEGVQMALLLAEQLKVPLVAYFMDDWMAVSKQSRVHDLVRRLLHASDRLMFISEALKKRLYERYALNNGKYLVVHNPVVSFEERADNEIRYSIPKDEWLIVYAGSIWPMHYDSLLLFARAIDEINRRKSIVKMKLLIHSRPDFWERYKNDLQDLNGVAFGGFVPYAEMPGVLHRAGALLVTASFLEMWRAHSETSVQTKLTDYMAALKPVISIGPGNGACSEFVRQIGCGHVITSDDVGKITAEIIAASRIDFTDAVRNGYRAIRDLFNVNVVHKKLFLFLNQ